MTAHLPSAVLSAVVFGLAVLLPSDAASSEPADPSRANQLELIDSWLGLQRAYDRVPGLSAALVHDQDLLWSGAFGFADVESQQPAATDTIYGICSISKLFTGIAAMQLRDEGKLRLDDAVPQLLSWFDIEQTYPGSPTITLEGLLTHSAGLPRESDSPYWMGPDFAFPTQSEVRERLGSQSTLYPASRYFQYSNLGLTMVGEIVEQVSGEAYSAYIHDRILAPLGLADTDTGFPSDAREPRIATGYAFPDREGRILKLPRYDTKGITPAAGFTSTALDLARFASWQFRVRAGADNPILASNTLREMQTVHWIDWDWSTSWGLAFGIYRKDDRTLTGHAGSCPGFNTRIFIDPITLDGAVVMANRNSVDVDGYARTMLAILAADGAPDESDGTVSPDLAEYVGSYDLHPWSGEQLVFAWKDSLAMTFLPTKDPLGDMVRLKHIEEDRFRTIRSDGELGHEVVFLRDETGRVSHVKYHSIALPKM